MSLYLLAYARVGRAVRLPGYRVNRETYYRPGAAHNILRCPLGCAPVHARSWLWVDPTTLQLPTSTLLHRLRVATSAPTDG